MPAIDSEAIASAAYARALAALSAGDSSAAEEAFREAAEAGDLDAVVELGMIWGSRGELDRAEAAYRSAVDQGHSEAALNLANLYSDVLGRPEDARRLLEAEVSRGDRRAMFELGYLNWDEDDCGAAAAAFEAAIDAGDPRGHLEMGYLLADQGRDEEALAAFEEAASLGLDEAWTQLGWQLARLGRLPEAQAALERGHALGYIAGDDVLADVLEKVGRTDDAAAIRAEAARWARDSVSLEYRKVMADLDGDPLDEEGLATWRAETRQNNVPDELVALLYDAARLSEAETRLRLAIEHGNDAAREQLARLMRMTGRSRQADALMASPDD